MSKTESQLPLVVKRPHISSFGLGHYSIFISAQVNTPLSELTLVELDKLGEPVLDSDLGGDDCDDEKPMIIDDDLKEEPDQDWKLMISRMENEKELIV